MVRPTISQDKARRAAEPTVSERRRALGRKGPAAFAKVYLPHLLVSQSDILDADGNVIIAKGQTIDFSEFAEALFAEFGTEATNGRRWAEVAPRGFAKSTILTILVLWWAAYEYRDFVVWTAETASQVEELVASVIDELESNVELREDFPGLLPAKDDRGNVVKWTDRDLVTASGFRLSARGAQKATRGLRRGAKRPDVFLCDDAEGESTTGETQYPKVRRWVTRVVAPALAPGGDILWVNTLIDWTSVTGALIRGDEDWTQEWVVNHRQAEWFEDPEGRRVDVATLTYDDGRPCEYGAEDLTHRLLWPTYWPVSRLEAFKKANGILAYSYEMLNRPRDEGDKVFRDPDWLKWFSVEGDFVFRDDKSRADWINANLLYYVTAIDPAFGGKDYAAVVTVAVFQHDFFVREAYWSRGAGIREAMVREAVRQAEFWKSRVIVTESTAAQVLVADEFIRRTRVPVVKAYPSKNKVDRALPVAIRASQGHVYFESGIPNIRALREILLQFPGPMMDDPVDAFVMAVEGAAELRAKYLIGA